MRRELPYDSTSYNIQLERSAIARDRDPLGQVHTPPLASAMQDLRRHRTCDFCVNVRCDRTRSEFLLVAVLNNEILRRPIYVKLHSSSARCVRKFLHIGCEFLIDDLVYV